MGEVMKRRVIDMLVRILILVAVLNGIAACTTTKGTFCQVSNPIRLSSQAVAALSDEEVKSVLSHNRKGAKLCGWRQ